ncbi:MAG: hypothetical protein IJO63_02980, partial [Bacilli bacterium]|nr:hypothetical protein [Bacilli bacterium]
MNKKRYIIVIVLLLFIGLGIFTFANPAGETNELSGNSAASNETSNNTTTNTTDDNKDNSDVAINQNNNNNNAQNNTNNNNNENTNEDDGAEEIIDEAYNKALAAVIEAEEKLSEEAYETAMGLVTELDETNPNKENLESRLSEVNNEMIVALVETLKEMTLDALEDKVKEDLDEARDYRTDKEVVEKVAALENDLGTVLANVLDELAKTLDDVKGPEFNIEDGALLNSITTIEVKDAEENVIISLILVDKDGVETPVTEGLEVVDGTYTLIAMDAALNESEVTFTLDSTKPEVDEVTQLYEAKEGGRIKLTVVFSEEVAYPFDTLNWRQVSETEYYTYFYKTKDYTINFADLAGNENSYTLAVDRTAPAVESLRIMAHNAKMAADYVRYVNNGDRVLVYLTLSEESYNVA